MIDLQELYYFLLYHKLCPPHHYLFFFFNDTATTEIYTLSLHDALPISARPAGDHLAATHRHSQRKRQIAGSRLGRARGHGARDRKSTRLLQSRLHLVCRLLLEKKKKTTTASTTHRHLRPALSTSIVAVI